MAATTRKVTFTLTQGAIDILATHPNRSTYVDYLIRTHGKRGPGIVDKTLPQATSGTIAALGESAFWQGATGQAAPFQPCPTCFTPHAPGKCPVCGTLSAKV